MSLNENNYESIMDRVQITDFCGLADYIFYYPTDILPTSLEVQENKKLDFTERRNKMLLLPWGFHESIVTRKVNVRQSFCKQELLSDEQLTEKFKRYKEYLTETYSNWSKAEDRRSKSKNIFDMMRSEKDKIHPAEKHDINDVKGIIVLYSLVDNQLFTTRQKCYIHPNFGEASVRVGAKVDLIIGNTLIDIKTTIGLRIGRLYFNQLICYYILSLIGGINKNPLEKPIENIGIYFARYGILWSIPISQLGDSRKFENFRKWFISFLRKKGIADLRGVYKQPKLANL